MHKTFANTRNTNQVLLYMQIYYAHYINGVLQQKKTLTLKVIILLRYSEKLF
jgi:hypothetical protein